MRLRAHQLLPEHHHPGLSQRRLLVRPLLAADLLIEYHIELSLECLQLVGLVLQLPPVHLDCILLQSVLSELL